MKSIPVRTTVTSGRSQSVGCWNLGNTSIEAPLRISFHTPIKPQPWRGEARAINDVGRLELAVKLRLPTSTVLTSEVKHGPFLACAINANNCSALGTLAHREPNAIAPWQAASREQRRQ